MSLSKHQLVLHPFQAPTSGAGCLVLEDGSYFPGKLFGAVKNFESFGEVIFNTALTGYEEVITDPSYRKQIVVMTASHIGNYGVTMEDAESSGLHIAGLVVREISPEPSNWRAIKSLPHQMEDAGVLGIADIDTRTLTLHLRSAGAMRGVITRAPQKGPDASWIKEVVARIKAQPSMEGSSLAGEVSVERASIWEKGRMSQGDLQTGPEPVVAVWDFGIKWSILRSLEASGVKLRVFPHNAKARDILDLKPSGIVLSNGPGDPAALSYAVEEIKQVLAQKHPPVLGICMGHQLLGRATGAKTFKMKFGHHGVNHPVQDKRDGRVWITSHNHGFAVDPESLSKDVSVLYTSLNDQALEGMESQERNFMSVQFHPEAAPGPWEAAGVFKQFREKIAKSLKGKEKELHAAKI